MKRQELLRILDLVMPAVERGRIIIEEFGMLCFNGQTVTVYNGVVGVSAKLETGFQGLIDPDDFAKTVRVLKDDEIRLIGGDGELTLVSESTSASFYAQEGSLEHFDLGLWREDADWLRCPQDLFEGISLVLNAISRYPSMLFEGAGVTISKDYVFAGDEFRFCRYKLASTMPFNLTIAEYRRTSRALAKCRNERVLGVARHEAGLLFDFADFKVLVSVHVGREMNTGEREGFLAGSKNMVLITEDIKRGVKTVAALTGRYPPSHSMDELMEVRIEGREISFKYKPTYLNTEGEDEVQTSRDTRIYSPKRLTRFLVNRRLFAVMVKRARLMGWDDRGKAVFFKAGNVEYAIKAQYVTDTERSQDEGTNKSE